MTVTPPNSRILVIRNCDRTWVPLSPRAIPSPFTLGMPLSIARDLAVSLNRCALESSNRKDIWFFVVHRDNGTGYAVTSVRFSPKAWQPEDEYALPPDAGDETMNCIARKGLMEFNKREMQLCASPEFWAVHIKPLKDDGPAEIDG